MLGTILEQIKFLIFLMIFSKKVHFLELDLVDSDLQMGFWRLFAFKMTYLRAQEELWDRVLHHTLSNQC